MDDLLKYTNKVHENYGGLAILILPFVNEELALAIIGLSQMISLIRTWEISVQSPSPSQAAIMPCRELQASHHAWCSSLMTRYCKQTSVN